MAVAMRPPLKRLKIRALMTGQALGLFEIIRESPWRAARLLILCYHGVSIDDEHEWSPSLYMSPARFRRRMERLRAGGYSVIPLDKALTLLYERRLPPRSVSLTFDDGAADFFLRAHPILCEFDLPATVYLTTYYCGHPKPVFGVFASYLMWKARGRTIDARQLAGPEALWDLRSAAGRRQALAQLTQWVSTERLPAAAKDELAAAIANLLGLDYQALVERRILQLMTAEEVATLARAGIGFELHSHRHRVPLDRALFLRELDENRQFIQQYASAGTAPAHFCYPSGVHRPEFLPWLAEAGVRSATTCESGMATVDTKPLLLPRVIDGEHLTEVEFESWLSGIGAFLPRRRAYAELSQ